MLVMFMNAPTSEAANEFMLSTISWLADRALGVLVDYLSRNPVEELKVKAMAGDAEAQYNFGLMYYLGEAVTKDYSEALRWWRMASKQDYAPAQSAIGEMYENGEGVMKNYSEAFTWYPRAAENAYYPAQYNLGILA